MVNFRFLKTVSHQVSGDPHLKLPPGGIWTGTRIAKAANVINKANKVLVPVAIAILTARVVVSVYKDGQNNTSRNTVGTVAFIAGGWSAGFGGATGGAAIGTAIFSEIGTIIGGIVGGLAGGICAPSALEAIVDAICDGLDYDCETRTCKNCGEQFKVRYYKGDKANRKFCDQCQ